MTQQPHMSRTNLHVNGELRTVSSPPLTPLSRVLREELHLTGTKMPCGEGFCGGCMVFVDDEAVPSCLMPVAAADGAQVRTIESLAAPRGPLNPVQGALKRHDAVQCGMCFPGMVVSLTSLLEEDPRPTREQVNDALVGNICRCTGYDTIVNAVVELGSETSS